MNLKLHLATHKICCPKPIKNNVGHLISTIKNKPSSVVSFLNGATLKPLDNGLYDSITENHCGQIGKTVAFLHNSVIDFKGQRKNDLGILGWKSLFEKIADQIDNYQFELRKEIQSYINFLENNWQNDYASGAIHAERAGFGVCGHAVLAEIDFAHMLTRGQHGDDGVSVPHRIGDGRRGFGAMRHGARHGVGRKIEGAHVEAGLRQIGGHAAAHIAQTDKGYDRHGSVP